VEDPVALARAVGALAGIAQHAGKGRS